MKNVSDTSSVTPLNSDVIEEKKKSKNIITKVVAFLIILAFLGFVGFEVYKIPTSTVIIDFNSSITLKINRWNKVVDAYSLDNDGITLINKTNLINMNIDDCLILIINSAEANNFIKSPVTNPNQTVTIYISGSSLSIPKFYKDAKGKKYDIRINENGTETFDNYSQNFNTN